MSTLMAYLYRRNCLEKAMLGTINFMINAHHSHSGKKKLEMPGEVYGLIQIPLHHGNLGITKGRKDDERPYHRRTKRNFFSRTSLSSRHTRSNLSRAAVEFNNYGPFTSFEAQI